MNQAGIEKLFKSYKKDARKILFKEGKSELEIIVSSLGQICNVDAEEMNYDSLKTLCDIYVDTFVRKAARQEDVDIILDMPKKHNTYVKDIDVASKIMAFLVLHSSDSNYKYQEDENFIDLVHTYLDSFRFMKENEGLENKYLKDDEYGLVETKPIYTHGQTGTELYFSTLMGKKDDELLYQSGLVEPNKHIKNIELSRPLSAGEYDAYVCIQPYKSDKTTPTNSGKVKVKLVTQ